MRALWTCGRKGQPMSVKMNIPSYLQSFTNDSEAIEVDGSTIHECLKHLIKKFPEIGDKVFDKDGKLHSYVTIYVDGEFAYQEELVKPVEDGTELHLLYVLGGG